VNLGAASTVRSTDLKAVGEACGFARTRTYIASGNLLFDANADEATVKAMVEKQLAMRYGRPIPVVVRDAAALAGIRDANPFPHASGNRVAVILLDVAPPADALAHARHVAGEEMALGAREIYVRYTDAGMGRSKLVIPAAEDGTARNMNTIAKLAELAGS
jgi:uncharacterized protein (DUF1697 family)